MQTANEVHEGECHGAVDGGNNNGDAVVGRLSNRGYCLGASMPGAYVVGAKHDRYDVLMTISVDDIIVEIRAKLTKQHGFD